MKVSIAIPLCTTTSRKKQQYSCQMVMLNADGETQNISIFYPII